MSEPSLDNWRRLIRRRNKAVRLVEELNLRANRLQPLFDNLRTLGPYLCLRVLEETERMARESAEGQAMELGWRQDESARILFWIADAPHHVGQENLVASALRTARAQGLHVYPIAASGTDDRLEYTMRSAAQLTGGRYLFLTDDSGVGGSHQEPHIPCYFVTRLASAMLRMVTIELSGEYRDTKYAKTGQVPTGGDR